MTDWKPERRLLRNYDDAALEAKVDASLAVIAEAFDRWPASQLAFSFNGGKDCCVVLHLLHVYAESRRRDEDDDDDGNFGLGGMKCLYWVLENGFAEVRAFMEECAAAYRLRVCVFSASFEEGLRSVVDDDAVRGIFMGQRRIDPHASQLEAFAETDADWPSFMRINPILDWSYTDVWAFTDAERLRSCALYARGYTSIGDVHNTRPNPALRIKDGEYRHARELKDGAKERDGRTR